MSKISSTLTALYVFMVNFFNLEAKPQLSLARVSTSNRRGATFIEYALLAAIALFVFFIFRTILADIFTNLLNNIRRETT